MYTLGCQDTATVVMNYLSLKQVRMLLCVNTHLYTIRNIRYYSIRVIQEFFKKYKKIKCHENKYSCTKITLTHLIDNSLKYMGKTIQFILRKTGSSNKVLWHCKFGGSHLPQHNIEPTTVFRMFFSSPLEQGIIAVHVGHVNANIYSKSSCNRNGRKLDDPEVFIFFERDKIYEYSIRIID